ncbi:MAG: cell wall-binding protein, partial [Candidatus Zixiibacteriota bacterium]
MREAATTAYLFDAAWSGTRHAAVGRGGVILTSSDAVNWTRRPSPTARDLFSIVRSDNRFVAVGDAGTIITSSDGLNWSEVAGSPTSNWLYRIAADSS